MENVALKKEAGKQAKSTLDVSSIVEYLFTYEYKEHGIDSAINLVSFIIKTLNPDVRVELLESYREQFGVQLIVDDQAELTPESKNRLEEFFRKRFKSPPHWVE